MNLSPDIFPEQVSFFKPRDQNRHATKCAEVPFGSLFSVTGALKSGPESEVELTKPGESGPLAAELLVPGA